MWAWANTSLPPCVTARSLEVQRFGKVEGVNRLTEPLLPDDEYLGWEMTAVMARIIAAKGAYRCPGDKGFVYVVYTDLKTSGHTGPSKTLRSEDGTVECEIHGRGQQSYICEHLLAFPRQEWFSDEPSERNPWPDAWCAECDKIFQTRGEWNDENSARLKIKLVCHRCYESLRKQETPA